MQPFDQLIDSNLYPDLVGEGGLAEAIEKLAQRHQIELGPIGPDSALKRYYSPWIESDRGTIAVYLGADERSFLLTFSGDGHQWAWASTDSLLEAIKAIDLWRRGAALAEMQAEFPFFSYDERSQAYENGDDLVALEWRLLLSNDDMERSWPLLQAAYENDQLRLRCPYISHNTLIGFKVNHLDRSAGSVWFVMHPDGSYWTGASWRDAEEAAISLEAAISQTASYLDSKS